MRRFIKTAWVILSFLLFGALVLGQTQSKVTIKRNVAWNDFSNHAISLNHNIAVFHQYIYEHQYERHVSVLDVSSIRALNEAEDHLKQMQEDVKEMRRDIAEPIPPEEVH